MPPTTSSKRKIFVYGMLKPEYDLPRTATNVHHDSVRGHMYDIKKDAALVDVGDPKAPWCRGYVMEVDDDELKKIEKFELPEYHKKITETWSGQHVECFEYHGKLPVGAKPITSWVRAEKHKGRKDAAQKVK